MKTLPDPNPCKHRKQYGETTWPLEVSLEHFDTCLTPERRLEVFGGIRNMAERGSRCTLENHATAVRRVQVLLENNALLQQAMRTDQAYISSMVEQLRELEAWCRDENKDGVPPMVFDAPEAFDVVADRIAGILGTRTQSVEQVDP